MMKKLLFAAVLAATAATPAVAGGNPGYWGPPAVAGSYVDQYPGYWQPYWYPYPNFAAAIPFGIPIVTSQPTVAYFPAASPVPLPARVYFVPQQPPYYNVPPYPVIEPY